MMESPKSIEAFIIILAFNEAAPIQAVVERISQSSPSHRHIGYDAFREVVPATLCTLGMLTEKSVMNIKHFSQV